MGKCAVKNCPNRNTDQTLCHRFPRNRCMAEKWQSALHLDHISLDTLISSFSICHMHFNCTDYRNLASDCLNPNAIPQLRASNPRKCPIHGKVQGQHRVCWELLMEKQKCDALSNVSMLDEASSSSINESNTFDVPESSDGSKNLKMDNASDSGNSHDHQPDSTDSDVEVLAGESMFESQSSESDDTESLLKVEQIDNDCIRAGMVLKTFDLVDIDCEQLEKQELIDIIKQQAKDIEEWKSKLEELKSAQRTLIGQFKVFRKTVDREDNVQR